MSEQWRLARAQHAMLGSSGHSDPGDEVMIESDPTVEAQFLAIGFVILLFALAWLALFYKTWRERREDRVQYTVPPVSMPNRDASRDRTLPGKKRIKARRSRSW
jgi:hypothetical protein